MDKTVKTAPAEKAAVHTKMMDGKVMSMKMQKTITVSVEHTHRHPIYKKAVKIQQKFAVHNDLEGLQVGDLVRIAETRPISKRTHFKVVSKLTHIG